MRAREKKGRFEDVKLHPTKFRTRRERMAAKGQSYAEKLSQWEVLITNGKPALPDMPHLTDDVTALDQKLGQVRNLQSRLEDLRSQARAISQEIQVAARDGETEVPSQSLGKSWASPCLIWVQTCICRLLCSHVSRRRTDQKSLDNRRKVPYYRSHAHRGCPQPYLQPLHPPAGVLPTRWQGL